MESNKMENMIRNARAYAIACHQETNHKYDGRPYSVHLQMVYDYAAKFSYLLPYLEDQELALASAWTHDVIEDCRQTYNDVKKACGEQVAEVTYALTNEKGKNRKERANSKYYEGIRQNYVATFVKICDRLANVRYSKDTGSSMIDVYRKKEWAQFYNELYTTGFQPMWDELAQELFGE